MKIWMIPFGYSFGWYQIAAKNDSILDFKEEMTNLGLNEELKNLKLVPSTSLKSIKSP